MQNSIIFKNAVSEKRLLNVVKEVSNFHRIQASPMFREAAGQTRKALEAYAMPEVTYFLETFMDSFSLTLDELK